jgi:hypothetical protein
MDNLKFTKSIKNKWLKALKSGKYTQCIIDLVSEKDGVVTHCCLGVLNEVCDFPRNEYNDLLKLLGQSTISKIYSKNDDSFDKHKPDYSNVIPLIEELKTEK